MLPYATPLLIISPMLPMIRHDFLFTIFFFLPPMAAIFAIFRASSPLSHGLIAAAFADFRRFSPPRAILLLPCCRRLLP